MNDIVVENQGPSALAGAGLLESTVGVFESMDDDPFAFAMSLGVAALDALAVIANPLEEFAKAGVAWAIEHIDFLREFIEMFTGDPVAINALAETWTNISTELQEAAEAYGEKVAGLTSWEGDAATAYFNTAKGYQKTLEGAAGWAQSTSRGIAIAGAVVAFVKGFVMDLISTWVAKAVVWVLTAIASAVVSFGASVAAAATKLVIDATILASKLTKKISDLLQTMSKWCKECTKMRGIMTRAGNGLEKASDAMGSASRRLLVQSGHRLDDAARNLPKIDAWKNKAHDNINKVRDSYRNGTRYEHQQPFEHARSTAATAEKEAAKATRDAERTQDREDAREHAEA